MDEVRNSAPVCSCSELCCTRREFIRQSSWMLVALAVIFSTSEIFAQEDPFLAGVRSTDWLSPADELKSFQLPPGFEIQLVAAEPQILKPMNMAFDERGRIWLTDTQEYPYAAPADRKARDSIKILEDTNGDGRADKITTFADGLNIPIGIYPWRGGCIAFSIPYIWHLKDNDGDGVCDERIKLYGPMGVDRDTHGMNNGFRRGFDGWLYACHGFNNDTRVKGADGHEIHMNSGNTYRFRLDGSRIEQFTWGQVNPFGMTIDELGNLFTADCHSKPIYELLRGGYYPSFGKPDDGLGFVPSMMEHLHGSTAIGGIAYCTGENFPLAYRGRVFTGNVMTSRVNHDKLEYHGATIVAREEPDLVATNDPWFRPMEIQSGPDGAIYFADFYNKIIGHYEVPLTHPGRDRTSGRIWRVVYVGDDPASKPAQLPPDLNAADLSQRIAALDHPSLTYRLLATNLLVDAADESTAELLHKEYRKSTSGRFRSHALWVMERLGQLKDELLAVAARDQDRAVRVHSMKILSERKELPRPLHNLALTGLNDDDAFVQRAAADALGQHPSEENIAPLLALRARIAEDDTHLRHMVRMALRNQFRDTGALTRLDVAKLSDGDATAIAEVLLAVNSPDAGRYLVQYLLKRSTNERRLADFVRHAARSAGSDAQQQLIAFIRERFANDLDLQWELIQSVLSAVQQRGESASDQLTDWAGTLATGLLDSVNDSDSGWINTSFPGKSNDNPWTIQRRDCADGERGQRFFSTLPRGEQQTGVLRSPPFAAPDQLVMFIAGHDGFPDKPAAGKNLVRVRHAKTDEVIGEVPAPRNDLAQRRLINLSAIAGQPIVVELIDGDDAGAYAWLAVGRFEPNVVSLPDIDPGRVAERQRAASQLFERLRLESLRERVAGLMSSENADMGVRVEAARALANVSGDSRLSALAAVIGDPQIGAPLRSEITHAIAQPSDETVELALKDTAKTLPEARQLQFAEQLAATLPGAQALIAMIEKGQASPRLLLRPSVQERLKAANVENLQERVDALTAGLPTTNETIGKLIVERLAAFPSAEKSAERGAAVFKKHCAACHQLDGQGPLVGPQLDGIGNRGLDRLIEDILDPNRNVDVAFHVTTIAMQDGKVFAGLVRREEGAVLVIVDNKGEEVSLPTDQIDEQVKTRLSLMPENVAEIIPAAEFHDLIAFLLTKKANREPVGAQ